MSSSGRPGSRLHRAHLAFDLDALFPDEAEVTVVPWERAAPLGRCTPGQRRAVSSLIGSRPGSGLFTDLDPRSLRASQPGLTRAGVAYYLGDEYRRSGRTYADQFDAANKYPVVHARGSDLVLLTGHHRAAAALLLGEPLRARVAALDQPTEPSGGVAVTPSLFVGGTAPPVAHERCVQTWHAEVWINLGATAWLPAAQAHEIRHLGYELGIEPAWAHHQLHFAQTGRIRLPADSPEDHPVGTGDEQ